MLKLLKPVTDYKDQYIEMIREWQKAGGPYVPCIVEFDCGNAIESLDYNALLKVVDDYSKGTIFDYDKEYFESSNFYFIFDDDRLIGVGEIRHNLKALGKETIGHIACGIRPSERKKGYALLAIQEMVNMLKSEGLEEVVICHYTENKITPKILRKLNFSFRNSLISKASGKEIKCYIKSLK